MSEQSSTKGRARIRTVTGRLTGGLVLLLLAACASSPVPPPQTPDPVVQPTPPLATTDLPQVFLPRGTPTQILNQVAAQRARKQMTVKTRDKLQMTVALRLPPGKAANRPAGKAAAPPEEVRIYYTLQPQSGGHRLSARATKALYPDTRQERELDLTAGLADKLQQELDALPQALETR